MDDRSLKVLEFFNLLDVLKEFSASPLGRKRCETLRPSSHLPSIQCRLAEVIELKKILDALGDIPIRGLKDIGEIFKRLDIEGSVLTPQELIDLYHQIELSKRVKRFFEKQEAVPAPRLQQRVSRLSSLKSLEREILQAISTKGEILDRASAALSEVRNRIRKIRERAKGVLEHLLHQETLQPIFQEQLITLRNGRYVLPVKSDYKNRLKGIIHDQSQSHMTFFFEPLQVVPYNNEISILLGEEKEEEYRVLADLSDKMRTERQTLWGDFEMLGDLDLLYAMARFSLQLGCIEPDLNVEGRIEMKEARNPFLALQKAGRVVPIHLRMGDGTQMLILSGANAGGKTVALKTLGLLTLMVQSGLPIPVAEGSRAGVFQDVFAVIGDEQSIGENLSTFSSHLLHVNHLLEKAGPNSLILLDELGVGTHATDGCALAMGFLDQFREKGAAVVVTTHFDRLKVYGYLYPEVKNVAVEFDEETLEPRYTLSYGISGVSNAFLVAGKLNISEKVLEKARHHRDGGGLEMTQALEALERAKEEAEKERLQFLEMKQKARLEHQRLKEGVEAVQRKRQEIFSRAEERAGKAVQKVEAEVKEWIRRKREEQEHRVVSPLKEYRKAAQEIRERHFPSLRSKGRPPAPGGLKVGERVKIESLRSQGILTRVEEPLNRAEVVTGKAKIKAPLSEIVKVTDEVDARETRAPRPPSRVQGDQPPAASVLNVIGLTVEDALPEVDKFIDQALLHGLEKVQIVHGIGSGRLRHAIGLFLQDHRGVNHFGPGDVMKGGRGITLVELR